MTLVSNSIGRRRPLDSRHRFLHGLPLTALLIDVGTMISVGLIAIVGRRELDVFKASADVEARASTIGPLVILGWIVAIAVAGGYRQDVFGAGTDEFKRVLNSSLVAVGLTGVACYMAKFELSRGFFLLAFGLGIPTLLIGRLLLRRTVQGARRRGILTQRVLIAGSRSHVDEIVQVLRRESWLGYQVVGALTPEYDFSEETTTGIPILGNVDEASGLVQAVAADIILFAGGSVGASSQLRRMVWELERHHVQVVVAPSVTDISSERIKIRPVGGLPLIHIDPPTWTDASRLGKRLFDLLGSTVLLIAFAPLIAVVALQVRLHDGGPIFYRHTRIGRNGEQFPCLKFRTMIVDADSKIRDLKQQHGGDALFFKLKEDPRVTRPGRWLRRFSLDELPQLLNVWLGQMSLVGPRPQVAAEVALYDSSMIRRLHVRPGMTGLWQVSGRNDLTTEEAIRLDLYYVDNWSMLQDLSILGKTLGAVIRSRGAY